MGTPRTGPYVWVSWITPLLSGDTHCEWASWFQTHYKYDKLPSNFDTAKWMVDHTAMVRETVANLKKDGYTVFMENQNSFRFPGQNGVTLAGKPDIVALRDSYAIVIDCKTGSPKYAHQMQVLTYMLILPYTHPACKGQALMGRVLYKDHSVEIPLTMLDEQFRLLFRQMMQKVGGPTPLETLASYDECKYCSISSHDCPDRIDSPPGDNNLENDLF